MVLFLTTGAIFVMWLGEQITERGVGNGASLIIFFSIIERFWPGIFETVQYISTGATNVVKLIVLGVLMVAVVAGVVAITVAAAQSADPDPAADHGARADARRRQELHPAPDQLRRASCRSSSRSR